MSQRGGCEKFEIWQKQLFMWSSYEFTHKSIFKGDLTFRVQYKCFLHQNQYSEFKKARDENVKPVSYFSSEHLFGVKTNSYRYRQVTAREVAVK